MVSVTRLLFHCCPGGRQACLTHAACRQHALRMLWMLFLTLHF
jgi:hypothetical protein